MPTLIHACKMWGAWRSFHKGLIPQTLEEVDIVFNICARREDASPLTVNQLVASGISPRNTLLRRLSALIDRGIVARTPQADDKRYRILTLTKKGVGLVRRAANSLKRLGMAIRTRG